ncbi:MAG: hypothetical protein M0P91_07505 [Sulfuricurvum sp.]|uniref:hypothetical protein n=1 Tax=Sulfuricurvum sp. TaxID=2025608 RepID=UPI0025DA0FA7|nr:hypothetical protein [Sulfuricurvum sp.]MCK9373028.1 hypothetical protein [Sulfuricurvum sp.]
MIQRFVFFAFITISLLFNASYGSSYDENTLEIFSKIIPRFVLMSSQKNSIQHQLNICIVHEKLDERDAYALIQKIRKNYPSGIKNYPIELLMSEYNNIEVCRKSQIAFMFDTDLRTITATVHYLNKNGIFSVSYNPNYLEYGVDSSLFLGRQVTPYFNIGALQQSRIELDNALVQISKIYSKGDGR